MACSCQKGRTTFEVVADGGAGRVLYTSTSKVAADAIAAREQNAGSIVREKAKTA
jgi:hypothetical protein